LRKRPLKGEENSGRNRPQQYMKKLVILTGAGISQESGIPTFRDANGLWQNHDITDVASPQGWMKDPELVLKFYNLRRRKIMKVKPNNGHMIIAELDNYFDVAVVTQNIDDLHEKAGSRRVIHLHGNIFESRPVSDPARIYHIEGPSLNMGDTDEFGEQLRPNVVWFGEMVPRMEDAIEVTLQADIFIVAGTSLVVYPAAGLIEYVGALIPKFVVDPDIPEMAEQPNLFLIPEKAGIGMEMVKNRLLEEFL